MFINASLLAPKGRLLASHPALPLAQRVPSVHPQLLVHAPVLVPLKEEDLAVVPGEGGVGSGRRSGDERRQRSWVDG